MKKSVPAFVFGLLAGLACIGWGFIIGVAGEMIGDIITSLSEESPGVITTITILSWLCFFGGILAVIGASMCFKKAKAGGICLTIATVMCSALLIYLFVNIIKASEGTLSFTMIIIYLLPVAFLIASDILAFCAKKIPVHNNAFQQPNPYGYANNYNYPPQQPNYPPQPNYPYPPQQPNYPPQAPNYPQQPNNIPQNNNDNNGQN